MKDFADKIAVITGGGTGMGRELARLLVAERCDVTMCDVSGDAMAETIALCEAKAPNGVRIAAFAADVSDAHQMNDFATFVRDTFATDHINLLFNNAGIAGGGSFVRDPPEQWERVFNVCWRGVYNGTRSFMPMLQASAEGHIVNTSSVNGMWASAGPAVAHTAYSAAKFAVRGFTESLITDLRLHAPHIKTSVVMPGQIGTSILLNSGQNSISGTAGIRSLLRASRADVDSMSDEEVAAALKSEGENFRDHAITSAATAAAMILEGVRTESWRILVGDDAVTLDRLLRETPEEAYEPEFLERWAAAREETA